MNQAVFLDRDGVINEVLTNRVKYVNKPSDFYLLEGVGESVKQLNDAGFLVFVVTNQGGVGLGFMNEEQLASIHQEMQDQLAVHGALLNDIAYCAHKPNEGCVCRKPKASMLKDLADKHHVSLANSIMIGDREPDILAGKEAGCYTILVNARSKQTFGADKVFPSLKQAIPLVLEKKTNLEV